MTAILVPEFRTTGSPPAPRTATAQATPMPIAVAARRWQVSPASSVASVRADLPLGRSATARFTELVGLVDLTNPGQEAVALLVGTSSLERSGRRSRRRWLGPHLLDAARVALILDQFSSADHGGWHARGLLHVKRRVADVDAHVTVDGRMPHATITFGVDRDALDLVWAQTAGSIHGRSAAASRSSSTSRSCRATV